MYALYQYLFSTGKKSVEVAQRPNSKGRVLTDEMMKERLEKRENALKEFDDQENIRFGYVVDIFCADKRTLRKTPRISYVAYTFDRHTGRVRYGSVIQTFDPDEKVPQKREIPSFVKFDRQEYKYALDRYKNSPSFMNIAVPIEHPVEDVPFPRSHQIEKYVDVVLTERDVLVWCQLLPKIIVANIRHNGCEK